MSEIISAMAWVAMGVAVATFAGTAFTALLDRRFARQRLEDAQRQIEQNRHRARL